MTIARRLLSGLPAPAVEAVRSARTAVLWLASPLEALWRAVSGGRRDLPPLWLRRHAGEVADFDSPNAGWLAMLEAHGAVAGEASMLLDVGCGPGSLALALRARLAPGARYVGFDVHAPSVRWCARRFATDPRYRFVLARIASPYASASGTPVTEYRFPVEDGEASAVVARSVFTHLLEPEAAHYLAEVRRVLRPGGVAVISVFLFDPMAGAGTVAAFPYPHGAGPVRWRVEARPHAGVAFARDRFEALLSRSGLALAEMRPGFYPGNAGPELTGQDVLVLSPGSSSG